MMATSGATLSRVCQAYCAHFTLHSEAIRDTARACRQLMHQTQRSLSSGACHSAKENACGAHAALTRPLCCSCAHLESNALFMRCSDTVITARYTCSTRALASHCTWACAGCTSVEACTHPACSADHQHWNRSPKVAAHEDRTARRSQVQPLSDSGLCQDCKRDCETQHYASARNVGRRDCQHTRPA